jgi:hypothetical protein
MGADTRRRAGTPLALTVVSVLMLSACTGGSSSSGGSKSVPAARTASATKVDVCELEPAEAVSQVVERPLIVVGRTAGAPRNTTVSCDLGERFAEAVVTVTLAPDPISLDVFDAAYGLRAGGNPDTMTLGDKSYLRTEDNDRVLHVFVHGAVLSVTAVIGPPGSAAAAGGSGESAAGAGADEGGVSRVQLIRITRAAVRALPENPVVDSSTAPPSCGEVDATVLAETLGRPPTLDAGLAFDNGALMCSWSGQPGSVTMTLTDDPRDLQRYLHTHPADDQIAVAGVLPPSEGRAMSSPEVAGDMAVQVDDDQLMTLQVIPAAGYTDDGIDTTASERKVAKAGLDLLGQMQ